MRLRQAQGWLRENGGASLRSSTFERICISDASRQLYGGGAAPWACASRRGAPARAFTSDIPGISIEMMAIDHSDASALVDVRRTSSAAVRQATASAVNRNCTPASSCAGKSPHSAGSRYRRSVASPERRFRGRFDGSRRQVGAPAVGSVNGPSRGRRATGEERRNKPFACHGSNDSNRPVPDLWLAPMKPEPPATSLFQIGVYAVFRRAALLTPCTRAEASIRLSPNRNGGRIAMATSTAQRSAGLRRRWLAAMMPRDPD